MSDKAEKIQKKLNELSELINEIKNDRNSHYVWNALEKIIEAGCWINIALEKSNAG